jgi:hypothetical protein
MLFCWDGVRRFCLHDTGISDRGSFDSNDHLSVMVNCAVIVYLTCQPPGTTVRLRNVERRVFYQCHGEQSWYVSPELLSSKLVGCELVEKI